MAIKNSSTKNSMENMLPIKSSTLQNVFCGDNVSVASFTTAAKKTQKNLQHFMQFFHTFYTQLILSYSYCWNAATQSLSSFSCRNAGSMAKNLFTRHHGSCQTRDHKVQYGISAVCFA
jgi:hypothetical protein